MCSINTHKKIDSRLCGECIELKDGFAKIQLNTIPQMQADERGLIHGGFIFGLADYACMLAVNHPNVVLASSSVKFLKPVRIGDTMICEAVVNKIDGKKHFVSAFVKVKEEIVFEGDFLCIVPSKHVLDM